MSNTFNSVNERVPLIYTFIIRFEWNSV